MSAGDPGSAVFVRDTRKNAVGSGGYLRSLQIAELVGDYGGALVDLTHDYQGMRLQRWWGLVRLAFSGAGLTTDLSRNKACGRRFMQTRALLDELSPSVSAFLWEYTQHHGPPGAARSRNVPVIALPHNLESLVAGEVLMYAAGDRFHRFKGEIEQLASADRVFVISDRDKWLLSLFGVETDVLPYYPPRERRAELALVRSRRPRMPEPRILVMGSAFYRPNYLGMKEVIYRLAESGAYHGHAIDVMGFGTEQLARDVGYAGVVDYHGAVTETTMYELMRRARVAVAYQQSGSGALTRIPELLLAGIPIMANDVAGRGVEHYQGLRLFHDCAELPELLRNGSYPDSPVPPPPRPESQESRFLTALGVG